MEDSKLRKENIVWTTSEDYSYIPVINLFDSYNDFEMDYYRMALLGYLYKVLDMEKLFEYLSIHLQKTKLKNEFLKMVELYLDDCFGAEVIKDRPGVSDYRNKFYDKVIKKYEKKTELSVEQELEYVYVSRIKGNFVKCRNVTEDLVNTLRYKRGIKDIDTLINDLNAVFLKYFYANYRSNLKNANYESYLKSGDKENNNNKIDNNKEFDRTRLNFSMRKKHVRDMKHSDLIGDFSIESAEFTKNISEDEKIVDERINDNKARQKLSSNQKIKSMIETRFGESIFPDYYTNGLEKEICTGIHNGIKIHFTEGKFISGKHDKFYSNAINIQREKNLEYYKENELLFRRSINELREILGKKLLLDEEDEFEFTNNGKLIPSKIWKSKYLNDDKIFIKNNQNEIGSISVDILLDASSSQMEREEYVSSQAFIIAEALTSLNIPTRVTGFCNFFNYLVLTQYRDYNDPRAYNNRLFNYKIAGSNRDGLAIKLISRQMDLLEKENKVLIVLSDGKPNDKINLGITGLLNVEGQDYEDEVAVKDTAQEIFNAKLRDKYVLGIFTGEDEDLEIEKKIYGKDFAYIKNIERFSHIIGFFITQVVF
ncbi:hypothetical protein [Peptostreptococcus canis]|uniref:Nitric oxide reductase activation protein n=1 Tax=Peptostreptococcus canis TaxID=1159213 RepID=A0ABR6TKC9_9FIRM|nr:hypothetical protein [Peptostreptococcus canis]MBC2575598.1 hypothetical protein [Peptostreptococcus canis]